MGLDLYFNRKEAVDAGLQFTSLKDEDCILVPGTDINVSADHIEDSICVRANQWGRVYAPMTAWLIDNNITWKEHY